MMVPFHHYMHVVCTVLILVTGVVNSACSASGISRINKMMTYEADPDQYAPPPQQDYHYYPRQYQQPVRQPYTSYGTTAVSQSPSYPYYNGKKKTVEGTYPLSDDPYADYYRNPVDRESDYIPPMQDGIYSEKESATGNYYSNTSPDPLPPDSPYYTYPTDRDVEYVTPTYQPSDDDYYPLKPLEGSPDNNNTRGVYESFSTDNVVPYEGPAPYDNDEDWYPMYYDY